MIKPHTRTGSANPRPITALALLGCLLAPGLLSAQATDTSSPEIRAQGGPSHADLQDGPKLRDVLQPFDPQHLTRAAPERPQSRKDFAAAKSAQGAPAKHCCAFRVYDAHTRLYDDRDHDGYYSYLQLDFDVDTDYEVADIYADVWLIDSYGEETLLFATDIFTVYGHSGIDDYQIEAELVSGFDPDLYDVLIEVFDAYDDALVAHFGPRDSSAMSLLPMESVHQDRWRREVHAHGGGGRLHAGWLLLAAALGLCRFGRRRPGPGLGPGPVKTN